LIGVRPATPEDAANIARVHVESWHQAYDGIVPKAMREAVTLENRRQMWEAVLGQYGEAYPTLVAATETADIVGFAMGGPCDAAASGFAAEFHALYMAPAFQRRDCGRRLFVQLAGTLAARGLGSAMATVIHTPQAAGFFRAMAGIELGSQEVALPSEPATAIVQDLFVWYDLPKF
jgi:L-amino acid N-acyltransferase YncA